MMQAAAPQSERDTLVAALNASRDRFLQCIEGVTENAAQFHTAGDHWSILHCAEHVAVAERQMLAMGRALMAAPKLLMLDEPSLGLAPRIVRDVFHIITELKDAGVSILLIEQNARAALQIASYAYVLELGRVTAAGTSAEIANNPRLVESYLGLGGASY